MSAVPDLFDEFPDDSPSEVDGYPPELDLRAAVMVRNIVARGGDVPVPPGGWRVVAPLVAGAVGLLQRPGDPRRAARRGSGVRSAVREFRARHSGALEDVFGLEGVIARNLALLVDCFGLLRVHEAIVLVLLVRELIPRFATFASFLTSPTGKGFARTISLATGADRAAVEAELAPRGLLFTSGLAELHVPTFPRDYDMFPWALSPRIRRLLTDESLTRESLFKAFLAPAPSSTLDLSAWAPMAKDIDLARRLLRAGLDGLLRGPNLLFHGPTGAGKTELARALATNLSVPILEVRGTNDAGESLSMTERLRDYLALQRLLRTSKAGVVLFDEAEDVQHRTFGGGMGFEQVNKRHMTDLLELNEVPAIFITNDAHSIDPALLRRFTFALEFSRPSASQRQRIWDVHLDGETGLPAADRAELARKFEAPAGVVAAAARASRALGGGRAERDVVERIVETNLRLLTGQTPAAARGTGPGFRVDAVNASCDLSAVLDAVGRWNPARGLAPTVLAYGPPGAGKSEFANWLASSTGREVRLCRASDILDPFVGGNEQNIANAFVEAAGEDQVLVIDEVEGLLSDRRQAATQWEVSMVGELLQALETARCVTVCTTNLLERIDAAVLRRFVWKIGFTYLSPAHAMLQLEHHLARFLLNPLTEPDRCFAASAFNRMERLTPGDFAVVARQYVWKPGQATIGDLLHQLEAEMVAKGAPSTRIGFGR